jgi:uncharacterized repeat protein (TIGR01451 family)
MNRLLAFCGLAALLLTPLTAAGQVPITRFARFSGNINFVATGGSLRTQSNNGDSCAVGGSSSQALVGIPAGASIVAAYLYWGGSGGTPNTTVALNGAGVTAQRTFTATFVNGGTNFPFFGGFADITSRIAGNGTLTFSGLTVNTGAPHCGSSAVAAGWGVIAIYGSPSERLRAVNVFDGFEYFRGSAVTLTPDGFRIPATSIDGRMAIVAWEGDPGNSTPLNGFSESLSFNGTAVDDGINVPGSDPLVQPYDGTVNFVGAADSYGADIDTFDVSALLSPGQTSATTQFSAGGDLVLLSALVVSATSEPTVDLAITKTHTGNFTVGANAVYTLTVANGAGQQREDNTVVVTDALPAGLTFVSGVGTGWSCAAAGQNVTCTHAPPLNTGASLPPITLTVAVSGAAVPSVTNTASVTSASFDTNATNNSASDVTVVVGPDLSTSTKTVVDLNGGEPDPGDVLRYTITLRETAGVAATGVGVVDDIAAELRSPTVVGIPAGAVDASTGAGTGANGQGRIDVTSIGVPANGSVTIVFDATIAAGTPPATPIDNAALVTNPNGVGANPAAPTLLVSPSAVPSSGTKPLYLRSSPGVALSRTPPGADAEVTVAFGAPVTFALAPALRLAVNVPAGNIAVPLWLRRGQNGGQNTRTLVVALSNSVTGVVGSATQTLTTLPSSGSPDLVTFTLPNAIARTFPAGSTLALTITQTAPTAANRTTLVYPVGVGAGNDSRVLLNSATVVNVDSVLTFDAAYAGGVSVTSFSIGNTAFVRAVVSDPFGSFDIAGATVSIVDSASVVRIASAPMTQVADSGLATRTYEYAYVVPPGAPNGGWSARVLASEGTEGVVTDLGVRGFTIVPILPALRVQKTVAVLTDPINGATNPLQIPGSVQRYTVRVTNTGPGTVDASTLVIVDAVPPQAALVVGGPGNPVVFANGPVASGLSFNYAADVTYTSQPGATPPFNYTPMPDANGTDVNVTGVRIAPTGAMAGASGAGEPSFSVEFRVRVP